MNRDEAIRADEAMPDKLFEVRLCLAAYEMALRGDDTEVLDAAHDAMSVHAPDHYRLMLAEVDCLAASLAAMTAENDHIYDTMRGMDNDLSWAYEQLAAMTAERDAAIKDIEWYANEFSKSEMHCDFCKHVGEPCWYNKGVCNWEWRGPVAENKEGV